MDRVKVSTFSDGSVKAVVYRQPKSRVRDDGTVAFRPKRGQHSIVKLDDGLHWFELDTGSVVSSCRIEQSVVRSKNRFLEYALNHTWQWFSTVTISPDKHNRYSVDVIPQHARWMRNQRRRVGSLEYALVPELHKDGAIHFHALLSGLPDGEMTAALDHQCEQRIQGGRPVFNWTAAEAAWGWTTATAIGHSAAAVRYMVKYMTKQHSTTPAVGGGVGAAGVGMRRWSVSSGVKRCDIATFAVNRAAINADGWYVSDSGGEYESMVRWGLVTDAWVSELYESGVQSEV